MKLMPVTYQGFVAMDRRFSSAMLPWIVAEIRRRDYNEKLSLGIEDGVLQAYNMDFELQFAHRVHQMARFSQADVDAATFLYLMRDDADCVLYCYLFQAHQPKEVTELYRQMKEQSLGPVARASSGAAALTSLCVAISPSSSNFFEVLYIGKIKEWQRRASETFIDDALEKFRLHELDKSRLRQPPPEEAAPRRGSMEDVGGAPTPPIQRSASCHGGQLKLAAELKSAVDTDDHNRTMVLQVDRTDLRLISPDRKVILLHKQDLDITACMQGVHRAEHFGFICREGPPSGVPTYIGYVFKCESASIAGDAVAAITQAFLSSEQRPRPAIASCEHCPMVWFHRVCAEVEHLSDKKTQTAILRRLEQLEADEQMALLNKFRGAETDSVREQNEFLMMLLRAHCEAKQGRHIHDTAENRTEFLNQYLGGGANVFSKAKKSFDQFLKRRTSTSERQMSLPIVNRAGPTVQEPPASPEGFRSRASSIEGSASPERGPKSPMMDIFRKVGNSPKGPEAAGSWRQAIFKRVVVVRPEEVALPPAKRTPAELWRRGIRQAILLIRMEKENERLKAEQEESAVKRIKLEYDEMRPSQREVMEVWEMLTDKDLRVKCDKPMLLQAIRQGVPRGKRGEVWQFLAEQHCRKSAPPDLKLFPGYGAPYEQLLRQLTSHQHAILIDLGRTFPGHSYFSSPLGPGQLALFNLLKAYSLLDPEVGYCQGLSFVAGVLLLHMEEAQAFGLLRHLMFRRGMRAQYLPDMVGLHVRLYQLSRLLHDQLPDLYRHLDEHEVAPTLYAAPWILTVFASQFPLGFVTRVFDLVFLEGQDVVFRAALALLSHHKDRILACTNFEEIMDYFKAQLTSVDKPVLEQLMKKIYTTDVARQLEEYKVEYQVLQEEVASLQPQVEALQKLQAQNGALAAQNKALTGQLELSIANVQRLEKTRVLQQAQLNRLEMQSRGLDVTIATLGGFISRLAEDKALDVEIPDEVRRILAQIRLSERNQSEARGHNNLLKMLQEKEGRAPFMVKSLSTGRISVPADLDPMARTHSLSARPVPPPEKRAPFFSSSHSNILEQQRLHNSPGSSYIDIKVQECDDERRDYLEGSPTHSTDSGVGTPSSPSNHPLSNCGDVSFTYSGTKELKHLKSLKQCQRNSSPELL